MHSRKASLPTVLINSPPTSSSTLSSRQTADLPILKSSLSQRKKFSIEITPSDSYTDLQTAITQTNRFSHSRVKSEKLLPKNSKKPNRAMIEKLLNDYAELLETRRFSITPGCTSAKLGPGCYNVSLSTLGGQSFQFSTTSRFKRSELFSPPLEIDEIEQKRRIQAILLENKEMEKHLPDNKERLIKLKSQIENTKILEAKKKKELLIFQKRIDTQLKLDAKQRKFEYKVRREEIDKIAKGWVIFWIVCSWQSIGYHRMIERADLHIRSEGVLKRLYVLCWSIGKFKRLNKILKIRNAKRSLEKLVKPIKEWHKSQKIAYKSRIIDIIERAATKDMLFRLLAQWKTKITFIQRTMKHLLFEKKTSMTFKIVMWNKAEYKIFRELQVKRHALQYNELKKPLEPKAIFGKSTIPDEVKEQCIKKLLNLRVKEYIEKLKEWKIKCRELTEQEEKIKYKREATAFLKNKKIKILKLPEKPRGDYMISEADYRRMIQECIQSREKWEMPHISY